MSNNAYLEELEKMANSVVVDEPMNPDPQPQISEEDVAAVQAAEPTNIPDGGELSDVEAQIQAEVLATQETPSEVPTEQVEERAHLENAVIDEIVANMSDEELVEALSSKVASEMTALGSIAKLAEFSKAESEYITEDMQKQADELIEYMVSSDEAFQDGLERIASELFESEESQKELFSREGLTFTFEQLASLEESGLDKQANEDASALQRLQAFAGDAVGTTTEKLKNAIYSVKNLNAIGGALQDVSTELAEATDAMKQVPAHELTGAVEHLDALDSTKSALQSQQRLGRGILYGGGAAVAGGALYGGKKLYDHIQSKDENEEKIAGVLPVSFQDGTLNVATETETNGGIQKMSKEIVNDFLKVAGAAGLITIVNDEAQDMEFRKEASDAFDHISSLGHTAMGEEFAKVAKEIFTTDELHEIVAGQHTDHLISKVAFFVDATESSNDELEKIANAGGVQGIKAVGAGLKDAASNIVNVVAKKKEEAQGAGREYAGTLKAHPGLAAASHGAAGLAGGGLVAGGLAGYSALKNPGEYDIEQTAAALEEAMITKQAAIDTYAKADAFIRQYGHILNN